MSSNRFAPLRTALLALGCLLPLASVHAQAAAQPAPGAQPAAPAGDQEALEGRRNQKIEHLRTEDSGARVDETRYGGRTQQITVTPKNGAAAYEVLPNDGQRQGRNQSESGPSGNGPRVWNVLKF